MVTSSSHLTSPMSLEEYLAYDVESAAHYELVAGNLVEMPTESPLNNAIALLLLAHFLRFFPLPQLCHKDTEIVVTGPRTTVRLPDLMILTEVGALALRDSSRGLITGDMPPPALVVEVVSPGATNHDRDYRYKRSEYAARGIAEYWIVDPGAAKITVLTLMQGWYEETIFQGEARLISAMVPDLELTAEQILEPF
ncbi:MAG: Uma2 family endonuclease [Synechococcales bacterium]|nr:Uma2 family endonuclease [Synechococcales bacterium]